FGDNHGWKVFEGFHCFDPDTGCEKVLKDHAAPIYEYGRNDGGSITGGYVSKDQATKDLFGKYVFGDFNSGRMWALDLASKKATALGRWDIHPSTFGRDASGRIYVGAYSRGVV